MKRAALHFGLLLACLGVVPHAFAASPEDQPLLELARQRQEKSNNELRVAPGAPGLRHAEHELEQAKAPADPDCARSLGAPHFASLHLEVGIARVGAGDFEGASRAYRRALACRPRDPQILAALGSVLFDLRDFDGARETVQAALAIDARAVNINRLAGNLDFVAERWADAIGRYRYVAASDPDRQQAAYGQLMYWLAQLRGGIARPEYVARTPGEGWPQPLLLYMRGEYSEAELVMPILEGDDEFNPQPNTSTDERLCEALFYVGEAHWARGKPDVARDYFTALVNLKVIYFLEHGLALAEIAKLR